MIFNFINMATYWIGMIRKNTLKKYYRKDIKSYFGLIECDIAFHARIQSGETP